MSEPRSPTSPPSPLSTKPARQLLDRSRPAFPPLVLTRTAKKAEPRRTRCFPVRCAVLERLGFPFPDTCSTLARRLSSLSTDVRGSILHPLGRRSVGDRNPDVVTKSKRTQRTSPELPQSLGTCNALVFCQSRTGHLFRECMWCLQRTVFAQPGRRTDRSAEAAFCDSGRGALCHYPCARMLHCKRADRLAAYGEQNARRKPDCEQTFR